MVRVVFIDGTEEMFESLFDIDGNSFVYDVSAEIFQINQPEKGIAMFPREFVKYITMV